MALKRWLKEHDRPGSTSAAAAASQGATAEARPGEAPRSAEGLVLPIQPGWLVAYRGPDGKLRGGCDDREHGTVETGERREAAWTFTLTDGTVLPAKAIVSVAKVATDGQVVAAWTVRDHGLEAVTSF